MKHVLTLVALVAFAANAQAATVTFELLIDEEGPGTFNLYASSSLGDNFGISSYGVPLTGGIVSVDHKSPQALDGVTGEDVGFRLLRTADNNPFVSGGQNTPLPTHHLMKGIGQVAGNLNSAPNVTLLVLPEQVAYGAPVLLASGVWAATMPAFDTQNVNLGANVFTSGVTTFGSPGYSDNAIAQIETSVSIVPEPSTMLLAACASVGLLAFSRRRLRTRRG